eukprot:gene10094-18745_t
MALVTGMMEKITLETNINVLESKNALLESHIAHLNSNQESHEQYSHRLDSYEANPVADSLGFGTRQTKLNRNAVPTIKKGLDKGCSVTKLQDVAPRQAAKKLDHARVITMACAESTCTNTVDEPSVGVERRFVKTQAIIKGRSQGIQIFPKMTSRGIQCNLLQPCTSTPLNSDNDSDIEELPMDELSYNPWDSTMETSDDEDSYIDEYVC